MKILESVKPIFDNDSEGSYEASDALEIVKDLTQVQEAIREYTNKDSIIINSFDDVNVDNKEQFKDTKCDITSQPNEFSFNAIIILRNYYFLNIYIKKFIFYFIQKGILIDILT